MNAQRGFLLLITGILLLAVGMMLRPFAGYIMSATILAFVLMPAQDRLSSKIGSSASALLLTMLSVLMFLVPFAIIGGALSGDAVQILQDVSNSSVTELDGAEEIASEYLDTEIEMKELRGEIQRLASGILGGFSKIVSLASNLAIGISITLFVLYYLLKDGKSVVEYLGDIVPLPGDILDELIDRIYETTWGVVKGHILVAVAQGCIAGLGLLIAGVPNALLWTFVMIML